MADSNTTDVATILEALTSEAESSRKLAAYHLQNLLVDASFADAFVQADGMPVLKNAIMEENGNTLAYALGCFTRLLDMDMGWESVSSDIIERTHVLAQAVQLVVARPVINVLRNALFLLVLVVSRPLDRHEDRSPGTPAGFTLQNPGNGHLPTGLKALLPLLQTHEGFLDCLVERLGSADHALCANALHLVNALMRDSIVNGAEEEWPRFVHRLQDLGVIKAVEALMRGDALLDLAAPVLEFQGLSKVLLARWRDISFDVERPEHRATLATLAHLHTVSTSPEEMRSGVGASHNLHFDPHDASLADTWRRLGFVSQDPTLDFEQTGYLGIMDLVEFVQRHSDDFHKALLEQSVLPAEQRCPIATASLSVTKMLYEHFEVDHIEREDAGASGLSDGRDGRRSDVERVVRPLLLRWDRMHASLLGAFIRIWDEAGSTLQEFHKVEDLIRLLVVRVLGSADRKGTTLAVEHELSVNTLGTLRDWQLRDLNEAYDYAWGTDLRHDTLQVHTTATTLTLSRHLREQMHSEALQFMREQRVRSLLKGSWFPVVSAQPTARDNGSAPSRPKPSVSAWRFVRLSHDRRYLHHASFEQKLERDVVASELTKKLDLNEISSVDSSVSRSEIQLEPVPTSDQQRNADTSAQTQPTITSLTIYGSTPRTSTARAQEQEEEKVLLELHTGSTALASQWLDGLLMLLNQQPITADTNKLVDTIQDWGLKVRILNLRWEDVDWQRAAQTEPGGKMVPSREGLDREYFYDMAVV